MDPHINHYKQLILLMVEGTNTAVNVTAGMRCLYENRVPILKSGEDFGFNKVCLYYFRLELHTKGATVQQTNATSDLLSTPNKILIYFICVLGSNCLFIYNSIVHVSLTSLSSFEGMTVSQPAGSSL